MPAAQHEQLQLEFGPVLDKNVEQLKILNTAIFPVRYREQFYRECVLFGQVTQFAYHNDVVIGAIACRLERQSDGATAKLYIMTIGVLAPYRSYGVGTQLLEKVLQTASEDPAVQEAYLHVQTSNEEAIDWYCKRGFTAGEVVQNYYKRIECVDAVVLRRKLEPPPPHVHGPGCSHHH